MDLSNMILNILELVVIIVGGFLLKSYLPSYFEQKGKNLATKEDIGEITHEIEGIRNQYLKSIEVLKSQLERKSHAHQVRYEHEFKVLVDVWDSLIHLRNMTIQLRPIIDVYDSHKTEDQRKGERLREFSSAYQGFVDKVEKNRPFYPAKVYKSLTELIRIMRMEALEYQLKTPNSNQLRFDPKYWDSAIHNTEKIVAAVDNICETIRKQVAA
jgi:hypothetical protein